MLNERSLLSQFLHFVAATVASLMVFSLYSIVDGLMVSKGVNEYAMASVNLAVPFTNVLFSIGVIFAVGTSTIIAIYLGQNQGEKANSLFSQNIVLLTCVGLTITVLVFVFLEPFAVLLGAKGELLDYAVRYGRILMLALPGFALQNLFQSFFVTAEKPHLGFWFTVGAGCTNMVLDVVMVGMLHWGVEGAALSVNYYPQDPPTVSERLFYQPQQYQLSAPVQNTVLRPRAVGCLHQRLFRADDKPFHVAGQYPV